MSGSMKSILYEFTPSELQKLLDTSDSYCDLLRKVGLTPKGSNPKTLHKIINEYGLDETKLNENRKNLYLRNSLCTHKKTKKSLDDILNNKCTFTSSYKLLRRLVGEGYKEYKCENCGLTDWLGKPLSLQLEHIDGNHNNNSFDNLKILCPNCHSQTDTFAGKNVDHSQSKRQQRIKNAKERIRILPPLSREELKKLIRITPFIQIGKQFGVTDNAIRKWCDKYKLPRKASEIHKFTDEEWKDI